ncbi:M4 family metallopeptidase [Marinobacter zhejiangensis]|uniref:Thermolysin metallopeptidase, catalytic domain n=1 Tax=Marinobacter zhejiangensis TaxID=488535 RepID=A0A1I4SG19_9GAMM|nr:M4 family metallopeptidase [Marinobacter zhejiangensis]SFM63270.1 Thermolysin metallopeptidase, catalytic domain [Marinobacter zhejiangensis]
MTALRRSLRKLLARAPGQHLNRVALLRLLLPLVLCLPQASLAEPRIDAFDYDGKCLSDRLQAALATMPRDISSVRLPSRLADTQVQPGNAQGKAANAIQSLQLIETFFNDELGWSSVDGQAAPMVLLANLSAKMDGSCDGMNAFYMNLSPDTAHVIAILHGHRQATEDLAHDIDVVGHEFAHGFFKTTQGEDQTLEKAAINEGVADMFGITIRAWHESGQDLANTRVREDTFRLGRTFALVADRYYDSPMHQGAMRDLSNPMPWDTADHYDLVNQRSFREEHSLSGVVSLPFALMVKGGRHPRVEQDIEVQAIGFDKAIRIMFYTLKHRLPFNSMPEFATAVRRAAARIHGESSAEVQSVHNAFAVVGLLDAAGGSSPAPSPDAPAEPSAEPAPLPQPEPETSPGDVPDTAPPAPQTPPEADSWLSPGQTFIVLLAAFLLILLVVGKTLKNARRNQIRQAYQLSQPARPLSPQSMPDNPEPTPVTPPRPGGCVAEVSLDGVKTTLMLDARPQVLGRSRDLPLPEPLRQRLGQDPFLARAHGEIWYQPDGNYLYVRCLSDNGLELNGQNVATGDKVKTTFDTPVSLRMGETTLTLIRRGQWP